MAEQKPDPTLANYALLTPTQQAMVGQVITRISRPAQTPRMNPIAPFVGDFFRVFGERLQIHHALSSRHLSKDNFEYALDDTMRLLGRQVQLAPRNQPGHDIKIGRSKFSLKTQADKAISRQLILISKYMELGTGAWVNEADLVGQRDRFLQHLSRCDRIVTLRYFRTPRDRVQEATSHHYQLVEIPKSLLEEVASITPRMTTRGTHAKSGHCDVPDPTGHRPIKFKLYFDGGSERKLQIKSLQVRLCHVIGEWVFDA